MKSQESWMNSKWRPAMGWTYMIICILDFAIFPIGWSVLQALAEGTVTSQWDPLTLKGAGLFHMAMGAIVGVTAWSRGQEKLATLPTTPEINTKPTLKLDPLDPVTRNTRND